MIRKSLSKKVRFDVFKRDNFTCNYCGRSTPSVILEVDHIIPVSKNGSNNIDNLITSCFDCNRGKSNNELTSIPEALNCKIEILKEKELQYLEFKKLQKKLDKRINNEVQEICNLYEIYFPEYYITENFKISIKNFIDKLGFYNVKLAMDKSCSRFNYNHSLKYFCGICWNKIKES